MSDLDLGSLGLSESHVALITSYAVRIAGVLALLILAFLVAGWVRRAVTRSLERARFDTTLTGFFANLSRWTVLLLAVLACLSAFGVETTSFAAIIGASGLAIGLAFQGNLANFAAGIMLLVFRPFKAGDVVEAGGKLGKVEQIELFTTTLDTPDNRRIILPNATVFGGTITNVTHHPIRRVDVEVGVDYAASIDRTREVLGAAVARVRGLEEPAPQIVLVGLGASSVDWQVRIWANTPDFFAVKEEAIRAVKMALDEAGIAIPFPQMDVHLDLPPGAALAPRPPTATA